MTKTIKLVCNKNQSGLALGALFATMHLIWVIIVALGFGKRLSDLLHSTHFLNNPHTLGAFNFGTAFIGLIGAFIGGFLIGWVFAWLFNWFGTKLK